MRAFSTIRAEGPFVFNKIPRDESEEGYPLECNNLADLCDRSDAQLGDNDVVLEDIPMSAKFDHLIGSNRSAYAYLSTSTLIHHAVSSVIRQKLAGC